MKIAARHFFIIIFISIVYFPSFSQSAEGLVLVKNGEFEQAIQAFEQDLEDKTMGMVANYGLAKIYGDSTFSGFDLEKSWEYFLVFDEQYKSMPSRKRDRLKKEYKIRSSSLKNHISELAMKKAMDENSVEALDHFLEFFKKSKLKYRKQITIARNQLAFDQAIEANTSMAFEHLLEKYKKPLKSKSPQLWKEGQALLFEISMRETNWAAYQFFKEKHPKNPFSKDSGGEDYQKIHNLKDKKRYIQFLEQHPRSLFKRFAKNQLVKLLIQNGTHDEFNWFLLSYPEHAAANELWQNFFYMYIGKNGEDSAVDFAKSYPQYPFKEDLKQAIEARRKREELAAFSKIQYSNNPNLILDFMEKYPNSSYKPFLITILLQSLDENPSIASYERFLKLNYSEEINNKLITKLYDLYTYNLSYEGLRKFIDNYGAIYPDSARVKKDLALAERFAGIIKKGYSNATHDAYHQFILDAAPHQAAYIALSKMIEDDFSKKNWDSAKRKMKKYADSFQNESIPFTQLWDALDAPFQNIKLVKLSNQINSEGSEYAPVISADGNTLYFCGKNRKDNLGREDIFISQNIDKAWTTAQLEKQINTVMNNEAPEAISVDGTQIMMFKGGQLCLSNKTKNGWSAIEYLPKIINATSWQGDASISSDGKALLFASSRKDIIGFQQNGNYDIYVCLKNESDEWDQVINLGNHINTPYTDRSPFLHPDMKTLYFSSAGHGGFGLLDVYKTSRLDDTWTNWSTPINLGREINTTGSDWGYKISTDGVTAYFSFAPEGSKLEDIYKMELPIKMRPLAVSTISGTLKNSEGQPIDAEIIIEDLSSGEVVAKLKSNPQTGYFFVVLPDNRIYSYFIKKENYFPISNNLDLRSNQKVEINENLEMFTVAELTEKGMTITLQNIFFDTDKYDLKSESFSELNRVFNLIESNNFQVELMGHTDSDGEEEYNYKLSEYRANAVRNYLIKKGVPRSNITAMGYGEAQPVTENTTSLGKAKNRRVEIKFKLTN